MLKSISVGDRKIEYTLEYKRVKNINLRIRSDGSVYVSANRRTRLETIEAFITSKADFILNAQRKLSAREISPMRYTEEQLRSIILQLCQTVYPYFRERGVKYPQIKFRRMKSRWGSCCPGKSTVTFNIYLMYVPIDCIQYVVAHEFTHFLQANHSDAFYRELEKICPDCKSLRRKLREIRIPDTEKQ